VTRRPVIQILVVIWFIDLDPEFVNSNPDSWFFMHFVVFLSLKAMYCVLYRTSEFKYSRRTGGS